MRRTTVQRKRLLRSAQVPCDVMLYSACAGDVTKQGVAITRYPSRTQQKTVFFVGEACLPISFLAMEVYSCGTDHLENNFTVLLTARVCWTVYRAVAWQSSNQIRYSTEFCVR
jgi:hypothetical protein